MIARKSLIVAPPAGVEPATYRLGGGRPKHTYAIVMALECSRACLIIRPRETPRFLQQYAVSPRDIRQLCALE